MIRYKKLLAVVVGIAAVLTGLLLWNVLTNDNSSDIDTSRSSSTNDQTTQNDETRTYNGEAITSAKGAFSFMAPDGWKLTSDTSQDFIIVAQAEDMVEVKGQPVTIKEVSSSGTDARLTLVIRAAPAEQSFRPPQNAKTEEFGPVDGVMGTKYYTTYEKGDALGIAEAKGGERDYDYVFEKNNTVYYISYSYSPEDHVDNFKQVQNVIRTLKFLK